MSHLVRKKKQILTPDADVVRRIRKSIGCSTITAKILANRNITKKEEILSFFYPSLGQMRSPLSIRGLSAALERIETAIRQKEHILIFGDYDADGITATVVLMDFLQYSGARVSFFIPHRQQDGYGLKAGHIRDVAVPAKTDLIITVDCGSGSHDAAIAAREAGIDLIVTDHHVVPDKTPDCTAFINPKRNDCLAGFENLAGVGVAFCLLIALRKHLREKGFWQDLPEPNLGEYCDLVGIGTMADMVPLLGDNRILSRAGLDAMKNRLRPGMTELAKICGVDPSEADSDDITFRIVPRLNAAGRMDHAEYAVKLLRTRDPGEAGNIARYLHDLNKQRQDEEKNMVEGILHHIKRFPHLLERRTIVLANPKWNEGILGIAASRIVEKYYRPVILFSTSNGSAKGSGRSIPGIDLHECLKVCGQYIQQFGGHAMAAGLSLDANNLEPFSDAFDRSVSEVSGPDVFEKIVVIDCNLDLDDITPKLVDELELLKPFGQGNPEPLFRAENVTVSFSKIVGEKHRRMTLRQPTGKFARAVNAIHFNIDPTAPEPRKFDEIIFRVRWNRWKGKKTVQIIVEDFENALAIQKP